MADTKTTALTEMTTPVSTDILYIVDDPGASPLSQKITLDNLMKLGGRILISEQTPTGTGSVDWSSIPATYRSLEIEYTADTDAAAASSIGVNLYFNNDTTATNYRSTKHFAYGTNSNLVEGGDNAKILNLTAANSAANSCGHGFIKINDYSDTTYYKQARATFSYREDNSSVHQVTGGGSTEWESTAAINRVTLVTESGNYLAGSKFRLYGVY